jgi:hypothetical protein
VARPDEIGHENPALDARAGDLFELPSKKFTLFPPLTAHRLHIGVPPRPRERELLRVEQGKAKAVRFYIRTLEREPSRELATIVRATGGAIQAGDKADENEK